MAVHRIPATPDTISWGLFGADIPPVLTIASGDTVVLECVSGSPDVMPPADKGLAVPPGLAAIQAAMPPGRSGCGSGTARGNPRAACR